MNEQFETPNHVEVVEANPLEIIERANIDVQISTAHRFPRSMEIFKKRAMEMVSIDQETAESCIYRRPVGKDRYGKITYAEGESIRLAEIVAACYGNIRVQGMITEQEPKHVKAVGVAHDLETNYAVKAEVIEATVKKGGVPYDERMRIVVAKAAQSKAIRDAIFRVVPKSLCKSITKTAVNVIMGSQEPLENRRAKVKRWIDKLGIDPKRIYTALGVQGISDFGEEHLEALTGVRTALKDGDITLDEAFPPVDIDTAAEKTKKDVKERAGSKPVKHTFEGVEAPEELNNAESDQIDEGFMV
jgi:hypothetical protein